MITNLVADVLVVSDVHAMSPDVDVDRFMRFVDLHPAKRLVLAGDTLDFYMWRHGRGTLDYGAGIKLLEFLITLAKIGVEIVILPGNHDLDWAWLVGGITMPKRYVKKRMYSDEMATLLKVLLDYKNVHVKTQHVEGGTVIVHGHEGWQGDWLWRISEMGDRVTAYQLVGRDFRRKVMGGAPNGMRGAVVQGHGFYRRLAQWGRKQGLKHVIHGHTHVDGRRTRWDVILDCLPAWRAKEGRGGGLRLKDGVWERVSADDIA